MSPKPPPRIPHGKATVSKPVKQHWPRFRAQWDNCVRCPLHVRRQNVVHFGGTLPCTVLFIGEGPGEQEDAFGVPFIGRAGKRLHDHILPEVWKRLDRRCTYAIMNVVGCAPYREVKSPDLRSNTLSIGTPTTEEIEACQPHRNTLVHFAAPKACIVLGETAAKAVGDRVLGRVHGGQKMDYVPVLHVYHPAYLIRQGGPSSLPTQKTILKIVDYIAKRLHLPPS